MRWVCDGPSRTPASPDGAHQPLRRERLVDRRVGAGLRLLEIEARLIEFRDLSLPRREGLLRLRIE